MLLEPLAQPMLVVHWHIPSSRVSAVVTIKPGRCDRTAEEAARTNAEDVMFKNLMYVTLFVSDQDQPKGVPSSEVLR